MKINISYDTVDEGPEEYGMHFGLDLCYHSEE